MPYHMQRAKQDCRSCSAASSAGRVATIAVSNAFVQCTVSLPGPSVHLCQPSQPFLWYELVLLLE